MSSTLLTAYVLVWPAIASMVFLVLCGACVRDVILARKHNRSMV